MIALVAFGGLCWVIWYFLLGGLDYASYNKCEQDLRRLARSVEKFRHEKGRLPTTLEGVASFAPANSVYDPWGSDYRFRCPSRIPSKEMDIYSVGPDKVEGTVDDIEYRTISGQ